ncbi:MAG: PEP-CTERM sorting domain-containing protein [Gammaproteobacteria bacterium]
MKALKMNNSHILGAVAAGLLLSAQAMALPVVVTGFEYPSNPTTVRIQNVSPAASAHVYAGGFLTEAGGNSFTSWCVDIFQQTNFGQTVNNYTQTSGLAALGAAKTQALGQLATQAYSQIVNAATSGAFQIAIWEILNETAGNAYNLASGNFKGTNGTNGSIALAQSWLNNLGGPNHYAISVWQSPTRQDLAVFSRVTVPEAGSLTMLGLGLLIAGFAVRRRMVPSRQN